MALVAAVSKPVAVLVVSISVVAAACHRGPPAPASELATATATATATGSGSATPPVPVTPPDAAVEIDAAQVPIDAGPPPMVGACVDVRRIDWLRVTLQRNGEGVLGDWGGVNDVAPDDHPPELSAPAHFEGGHFEWGEFRAGENVTMFAAVTAEPETPDNRDAKSRQPIAFGDIDGDGCDEALVFMVSSNSHLDPTFLIAVHASPDGTLRVIGDIDGSDICGELARFGVDARHRVVIVREAGMKDHVSTDFEEGEFEYTYRCAGDAGEENRKPLREETYVWKPTRGGEPSRLVEQVKLRRDVTDDPNARWAPARP